MANLVGTAGNDSIVGTSGGDTIDGLAGDDTIEGGAGNDSLLGGTGFDTFRLTPDYGNDTIDGGAGSDQIWWAVSAESAVVIDLGAGTLSGGGAGGSGSATLISIDTAGGTRFDDHITAGILSSSVSLSGRGGSDTVIGGNGNDQLVGDWDSTQVAGNDWIEGRGGNDVIYADAGDDTLFGGSGDDTFYLSPLSGQESFGHDSIDGGEGRDTFSFELTTSGPMTVDLGAGTLLASGPFGSGSATFFGIENYRGSDLGSHDRITGSALANQLQGGAGNDTIDGALGNDTLSGGAGADSFVFRQAPGTPGADLITDFVSGADKLFLDPAVHGGIGAGGAFSAGDARFYAAAGASSGNDSSDRVVYNTSTGQVYYDEDGSGGSAALLIATLQGAPALAATDLFAGAEAPQEPNAYDIRTIQHTGPSANRIDIAFMGDGYTAGQIDTDYASHVDSLVAYLFDGSLLTQPFGRYESFFNIHAIEVISNDSGADHPGQPARDTALGASYNGRLLTVDHNLASATLSNALFDRGLEAEVRLVAVNDTVYGGSGGTFAVYAAGDGSAHEVALHEVGHQFAKLGDQYVEINATYTGTEPWNPDVTADPAGAKWAHWLGYDQPGVGTIGVYEGAWYSDDIYRPSMNSKMRSLDQPFDAVGREAFILEFYELVDPLDAWLANTSALVDTDELWVDTIDPGVIFVDWTINGTTHINAGERISLSALGYDEGGEFDITARAYDPTDWVRAPDRSSLEQSVQWQVMNEATGNEEGEHMVGTAGNDSMVGTAGDDTLEGLAGNDTLQGLGGNDSLDGGSGTDSMLGGAGDDIYVVTAGDILSDSSGIDTAFTQGSFTLSQASGVENLTQVGTAAGVVLNGNQLNNILTGSDANNASINGRAGDDTMFGMGGNDTFDMSTGGTSSYGNDVIDGGSGVDTIDFGANARSALVVNLAAGIITGGGDGGVGSVVVSNVENVGGGAFADELTGNASANFLFGGAGSDTLDGGAGNDRLEGGTGSDNYLFTTGPGAANADTIVGFSSGADLVVLDPSAHTNVGGSGFFAPDDARYHSGAGVNTAHDATDRVIYNTTTGQLWYDSDGTGASGPQLIATLQGAPSFTATDIFVAFGPSSGAFINGTPGDDSLTGTTGNDTINGLGGNDTLNGNGGSDSLNGGAGHDSLTGGGHPQDADGGDILVGGDGNDTLDGFNHTLFSSDPDVDTMDGGLGDDVFWADNEADVLLDAGGTDTVHGLTNWTLGAGFENLVLHTDASEFGLGVGNELANHMFVTYRGSLSGVGGNDTLIGAGGTLDGGDGDDLIQGNLANFAVGGAGNDTISGAFQATGGAGADVFHIDFFDLITDFATGTDTLLLDAAFPMFANAGPSGRLAAGDSRFYAEAGADAAHDASDRLIYNTTTGDLYYDSDGTGSNGAVHLGVLDGTPTLVATDIEVVNGTAPEPIVGTPGNDNLNGTSGDDTIGGLGGNDRLNGLQGADSLAGGSGHDTLDGGEGNDTLSGGGPNGENNVFHFSAAPGSANADVITDLGQDRIALDADVYTNIGATGNLTAERFFAGPGANAGQDASDRVIFNTTTGQLWYDPDGSGSVAAQLIATLQGESSLDAGTIAVTRGSGYSATGTASNDALSGSTGDDTLNGGDGDDNLSGDWGADLLVGGNGNDRLDAGFMNWGEGSFGDASVDTLDGGFGDDTYVVGEGDVILADPGGMDSVIARGSIGWTLGAGLENLHTTGNFGHGWGQTVGNELNNRLSADTDGASLFGMGGDDYLVVDSSANSQGYEGDGGTGNDTLESSGGTGSTLTGAGGADTFFVTHAFGEVTITDFGSNTDEIRLDAANMAELGASGDFSADDARFRSGAGLSSGQDATDRIVYNTSTGQLWYDADGSGSGAAQLIATLSGAPMLVASDISVVNGGTSGGSTIEGTEGNDTLTGTSGNDTIDGLGGNDQISGLEGADSLIGGSGNDTLHAGFDSSTGDGSADTLDGGLGDDEYHVASGEDTILADPGGIDTVIVIGGDWTLGAGLENLEFDDTASAGAAWTGTGNELDNVMLGTSEGGTLLGLGGNDTLILRNVQNFSAAQGGDGNDTLRGADQSSLFGNAGNDVLIAGLVLNTLTGGTGNDHFVFEQTGSGADIADFASGTDKIRLDAATMTALGTTGNFAAGDERFHAGAAAAEADDRVIWNAATGELLYDADGSGSAVAELIATVTGNVVATDIIVDNGTEPEPGGEVITGTSGNDSLVGTNGNDTLDGVSGNDTLNGLLGDDTYIAQTGDVIQDSGGTDTLVTTSTWNIFSMPIENVTLAGSSNIGLLANNLDNHVIGNSAANSIEGRGGSDTIEGGGGNDYFKMTTGGLAAFGFDVIDGGDGIDTVDYGGTALSGLDVDLVAGTVAGGDSGGGGGATITSIEKFISGNFNDRVSGSAENNQILGNGGNDTLLGLAGHDSLNGGDGNDWLEGGSGFDTLVGGAGNDSFVFSATGGRVTDFVSADQLLFDNTFFAALGAESTWAAGDGRFRAAAGATSGADADDRLVYNTTNGNLYYDADGAGGAASVLVTTLQNAPTLSSADITVI